MGIALQRLAEEDPTFRVRVDDETGQTIISGMGELHLEIIVDRMKREFNVEANIGAATGGLPRIDPQRAASKSKVSSSANPVVVVSTVTSGCASARTKQGEGFEFINSIKGGVVPSEYIKPVEQGIEEAMANGVIAGYPVVDVKAELYDGSYHEVDSNEMAFKIAGSMALQEGVKKASPSPAGASHESRRRHS